MTNNRLIGGILFMSLIAGYAMAELDPGFRTIG